MADVSKEEWWLDFSGYPTVLWAKLRIFLDGSAAVLDCDSHEHQFQDEESARWFLLEDEYTPYESIDTDDEAENGFKRSALRLPVRDDQVDLIQQYK